MQLDLFDVASMSETSENIQIYSIIVFCQSLISEIRGHYL